MGMGVGYTVNCRSFSPMPSGASIALGSYEIVSSSWSGSSLLRHQIRWAAAPS